MSEPEDFGVRCTTAAGEDVLVTVRATDERDAVRQIESHRRLFYGPGDGAGRWLASRNPDTIVSVHEANRLT